MLKFILSKIINFIGLGLSRLKSSNHVWSFNVHRRALSGKNIVIRSNTEIDQFSSVKSYCYIGKGVCITRSEIGPYSSIANNVSIGQGEHDLSLVSTSSLFYDCAFEKLTQKKCILDNNVWIGVDVVILRGVKVGMGAVVAANAVVTKDVPDFAIVAGVPAKVIGTRFDEEKISEIRNSHWWEKSQSEAKEILAQLDKL